MVALARETPARRPIDCPGAILDQMKNGLMSARKMIGAECSIIDGMISIFDQESSDIGL